MLVKFLSVAFVVSSLSLFSSVQASSREVITTDYMEYCSSNDLVGKRPFDYGVTKWFYKNDNNELSQYKLAFYELLEESEKTTHILSPNEYQNYKIPYNLEDILKVSVIKNWSLVKLYENDTRKLIKTDRVYCQKVKVEYKEMVDIN